MHKSKECELNRMNGSGCLLLCDIISSCTWTRTLLDACNDFHLISERTNERTRNILATRIRGSRANALICWESIVTTHNECTLCLTDVQGKYLVLIA